MHYANGREAKVGDLVVGVAYNTPERVVPYGEKPAPPKRLVGTLVKATPGSDYCNAEIEWVESVVIDPHSGAPDIRRPPMAQGEPRLYRGRAHFLCRDYTHCGILLHIEDVIAIELGGNGYFKPFALAAPVPFAHAADHPAAADQA